MQRVQKSLRRRWWYFLFRVSSSRLRLRVCLAAWKGLGGKEERCLSIRKDEWSWINCRLVPCLQKWYLFEAQWVPSLFSDMFLLIGPVSPNPAWVTAQFNNTICLLCRTLAPNIHSNSIKVWFCKWISGKGAVTCCRPFILNLLQVTQVLPFVGLRESSICLFVSSVSHTSLGHDCVWSAFQRVLSLEGKKSWMLFTEAEVWMLKLPSPL